MRELRYVNNPNRTRLAWALVYIVIAVAVVIGLFFAGSKIRTHSLPSGEIQLSIPYSKYLVGEVVTYSLKNNYNSPVYVANKCPSEPLAVYRYENNKWNRIHATTKLSSCPGEDRQVEVPARGVVNGTFASWKQLFSKPGFYRVVAYVEYYDALPYQDFEVVQAGAAAAQSSSPSTSASNTTSSGTGSSGTSSQTSSSSQNSTSSGTSGSTVLPPPQPVYTQKKSATVKSAGGDISVQYDSTTVYVTSIAPAAGCYYEGGKSGTEVEVTFKCSNGELQIQLWVQNGQLQAKTETGD